jgi:c-di-GMP-related signal transduction protein
VFLAEQTQSGPDLKPFDHSPAMPSRRDSSLVPQFIARQPILEVSGKTFGYELLYRSGPENKANVGDGNVASATVIDAALMLGLESLCGDHRAFINCTEEMLVDNYVEVLPPGSVVLEILEDVPGTAQVVEACRKLKDSGYLIALDDYAGGLDRANLLPVADFVKIEPQHASPREIASLRRSCDRNARFLAEKVETWEEVRMCAEAGCDLFQGYFYSRPQVLEFQKLRPFPATYLHIMKILSAERLEFAELARTLKTEPSLCYRLLRYLNSYRFGFAGEIRSLSHGLALIGETKFRKWLTIATLAIAGVHACNELLQSALVRARFCELLAPHIGQRDEDLFFAGLLSLFNVVMNISMEDLVSEIAVSSEVRRGLLENATEVGQCRELVAAYCVGNWPLSSAIAAKFNLNESLLPQMYVNSLEWARSLCI